MSSLKGFGRMPRFFPFGVFLLISNFVVGKLALPLFAIHFNLGLGVYLLSWLMLFAGLIISGKKGLGLAKAWCVEKKMNIQGRFSKHHFEESKREKFRGSQFFE
jgi:hypothetical protein